MPEDSIAVDILPEGSSSWVTLDEQVGLNTDWSQRSLDLSAYRDQVVRIRFRLTTGGELTGSQPSLGFWLDNLSIENEGGAVVNRICVVGVNGRGSFAPKYKREQKR